LHAWVTTVDHKRLGILDVAAGLGFMVIAGLEASLMRLQLAWSGLQSIPPETFNRLFTMHGTSMVFLVGIPIVLVRLSRAAHDRRARPRLAAQRLGFRSSLFGGLLFHSPLHRGDGSTARAARPSAGAYAPLTAPPYAGNATDY
jgi:cytochrome c oxidase subunit 1